MPYDSNLVFASKVDISADGNQDDQALPAGLAEGNLCQFMLWVEGAITGTDPTLDVKIQGKIGTNYYDAAKFPQLAASGVDALKNTAVASGGGHVSAFGRFLSGTTHYRYAAEVPATGTPVYNDVTIRVVPLHHPGLI